MTKILTIDNSFFDLETLRHGLSAAGYSVLLAETGAEGLRCLEADPPDLVLLNPSMRDMESSAIVKNIRADTEHCSLPVIMVATDLSDDLLTECLAAGADGYVTKPISFVTLTECIRNALTKTGRSADKESPAVELGEGMAVDPLTGVLQREAFVKAAGDAFDRSTHPARRFSVAKLDIDCLKEINARYGHRVGDRMLAAVGRIIREASRENDICGRMGGDEFAVCMPGAHPLQALALIEMMRDRVKQYRVIEGGTDNAIPISFSAGIAECYEETDIDTLLIEADMALYGAKYQGRGVLIKEEQYKITG